MRRLKFAALLSGALLLMLSACAPVTYPEEIYCAQESGYAAVLAHTLPGSFVSETQGYLLFHFLQARPRAVEFFELQAQPVLSGDVEAYWYPQYAATVIIAVDRSQTDASIQGWNDLSDAPFIVSFCDLSPVSAFSWAAISWGLEGEISSPKVAQFLRNIHKDGRLSFSNPDAAVQICFDYEAVQQIKAGRKLEIVLPREGTLTFLKGLISQQSLVFSQDADQQLLAAGFRLPDGRCENLSLPAASEYARATLLQNNAELFRLSQEMLKTLRRQVRGIRLFSTADGIEHTVSALSFVVLAIFWSGSMARRSAQNSMRLASLLTGVALAGWGALRLIKYLMPGRSALDRYAWYFFYLFLLLLPLLFLWMALSLNRVDDSTMLPKWWWVLAAVNGILFLMVLSNDFHQLVFRFPIPYDWVENYHYGFGYFLVYAGVLAPVLQGMVALFIRYRTGPRKQRGLFPLLALLVLIAYAVAYSLRVPIAVESDFTITTGLFTLLFFEAALRTGFIPVNTAYDKVFSHSTLKIQLINQGGSAVLCAVGAEPISQELRAKILSGTPSPHRKDENTLLYADPIKGGYVVWQENIQVLNRLYRRVQESVDKLKAANALLLKEEQVRGERIALEARSELFSLLDAEIREKLGEMSSMIATLPSGKISKEKTALLALLACYIKRRCNLFFLEREMEEMPAAELQVYCDELAEFASFTGVRCLVVSTIKDPIALRQATLFYDFLHNALSQTAHHQLHSLVAQLSEEPGRFVMKIMMSSSFPFVTNRKLSTAIVAAGGAITTKNLDEALGVWLSFPKGGQLR